MALINILAAIGTLTVIILIIYWTWNYMVKKNKQKKEDNERPTPSYMQEIGVKCPDYWDYVGTNSTTGNYTCYNRNNLSLKSGDSCYTDASARTTEFVPLKPDYKWKDMNGNDRKEFVNDTGTDSSGTALQSRCEWIQSCGFDMGADMISAAVWMGISNYC